MKRYFQLILCALILPLCSLAQTSPKSSDKPRQLAGKDSLSTSVLAVWEADEADVEEDEAVGKDSIQISLITCSPGKLVYELYGHTALRVREIHASGTSDWVFNYGTFSFEQPHFMWRFMLGETDYELGVVPYPYFYDHYAREGRSIEEQRLNLKPDEAWRLVEALGENLRPENATYRYNFFDDNCTTRAWDMIESCLDGKIVCKMPVEKQSLRDIVHEFSEVSPWNKFGQDLLLGSEADAEAGFRQQLFAPLYAMQFMEHAFVSEKDGSLRPLCRATVTLLPAQTVSEESKCPTPMWAFGILFAIVLASSLYECVRCKYYWTIDVLLLLAQGLAGCIVAFLFFFSAHPTVGSNWLVILFNPLPLIAFPWFMKAAVNRERYWPMYVQGGLIAAVVIAMIADVQQFPTELIFILLTLAVRVLTHLCLCPCNRSKSGRETLASTI